MSFSASDLKATAPSNISHCASELNESDDYFWCTLIGVCGCVAQWCSDGFHPPIEEYIQYLQLHCCSGGDDDDEGGPIEN